MGLDVTAHKNLRLASFKSWDEAYEWQRENERDFLEAFVIDDSWKDRISDLEEGRFYVSEDSESFVGYSYSTHSQIRSMVCEMMGIGQDDWKIGLLIKGSDFEEWLNFADNEGCMSQTTCKKLLEDFKKWEDKAKGQFDEYYFYCYENWIKTFEYASENGAVEYH